MLTSQGTKSTTPATLDETREAVIASLTELGFFLHDTNRRSDSISIFLSSLIAYGGKLEAELIKVYESDNGCCIILQSHDNIPLDVIEIPDQVYSILEDLIYRIQAISFFKNNGFDFLMNLPREGLAIGGVIGSFRSEDPNEEELSLTLLTAPHVGFFIKQTIQC
jgi:hypothetical protein